MAEIIVLTPEQLAERDQPRGRPGRRRSEARTRVINEFKESLRAAQPGYGGEVVVAEGELKRVVRQNLQVAANELGLALLFRPVKDPSRLQFRVLTPEERAAQPTRRGRPRKQEQAVPEQPPLDEASADVLGSSNATGEGGAQAQITENEAPMEVPASAGAAPPQRRRRTRRAQEST